VIEAIRIRGDICHLARYRYNAPLPEPADLFGKGENAAKKMAW
jgi:hypothetical protein